MKIFVLLLLCCVGVAAEETPLLRALIAVESRGNDSAIGDIGLRHKAYGCLQIRQPCVDDVNTFCGTSYRAEDTLGNRALSIWIFKKYTERYTTSARLEHGPTAEDIARIWNGGPNGWKKASTLPYWAKVQKALKK